MKSDAHGRIHDGTVSSEFVPSCQPGRSYLLGLQYDNAISVLYLSMKYASYNGGLMHGPFEKKNELRSKVTFNKNEWAWMSHPDPARFERPYHHFSGQSHASDPVDSPSCGTMSEPLSRKPATFPMSGGESELCDINLIDIGGSNVSGSHRGRSSAVLSRIVTRTTIVMG